MADIDVLFFTHPVLWPMHAAAGQQLSSTRSRASTAEQVLAVVDLAPLMVLDPLLIDIGDQGRPERRP